MVLKEHKYMLRILGIKYLKIAINSTWYLQMTYCKASLKKDVMDLNCLL